MIVAKTPRHVRQIEIPFCHIEDLNLWSLDEQVACDARNHFEWVVYRGPQGFCLLLFISFGKFLDWIDEIVLDALAFCDILNG